MHIKEIWTSSDSSVWEKALARYWDFVKPSLHDLEVELENLDLQTIRLLSPKGWYDFLHDKYFPWKYTAANRLATTRARLEKCTSPEDLAGLDETRQSLLILDPNDTLKAIQAAGRIPGLGVAGASGLLAILYPNSFAVVDQFVVKALLDVGTLPEHPQLQKMNPEGLKNADAVLLTDILRRKAQQLNATLNTSSWTARKLDKALWTFGRT